jgi:hypothetical protein
VTVVTPRVGSAPAEDKTSRISAEATVAVDARVDAAAAVDSTARVTSVADASLGPYDPWGGAWGLSWGTAWLASNVPSDFGINQRVTAIPSGGATKRVTL